MTRTELGRLAQLQIALDAGDDGQLDRHVRRMRRARMRLAAIPVVVTLILIAAAAFAVVLVSKRDPASPYMDPVGEPESALIRSKSILSDVAGAPPGGCLAHNQVIAGSTPAPATNLSRLNVRACVDVPQTAGPNRPRPSTAAEHNTGTAASAPPRTVDETGRRDGQLTPTNRPAAIELRSLGQRGAAGVTAESKGARGRAAAVASRRQHHAPVSILADVASASTKHGVPFHILAGLAEDESGWRPSVAGKNGEVGLMQLKRNVARWCGIKDRRHPGQNTDCGARYLAAQFARFGSWEMAVVAFKAGPASIPENIPASSWAYAQRALLKAEAYR